MNTAYVFPGQGSQVVGMGKDLYDNFSVAKDVFDEVDSTLNKKLSQIIFEGPQDILTRTENAQPAIMCISLAILRVLQKETGKSIEQLCGYVGGHSLGEYTALCAGGALSLADTTKLLKIRGECFSQASLLNPGTMCVLLGGAIQQVFDLLSKVREGYDDNLVCQIANDNTVGQVVLSGHEELINRAVEIASDLGFKKAVKLNVSGPFHSDLMQPAVEVMQAALNTIKVSMPKINFVSNATAKIANNVDEIKANLITQITIGVRWRETMLLFGKNNVNKIVEIGAGKTLTNMVSRTLENAEGISVNNAETLQNYIRAI
jgi:[acyl-carrier-protein] S-malonyltransferase